MISFRPAIRENVNLLLGLCGGTGSGKSFSAMRLAKGISDGKRFAVIDSENRRALHYAGGEFDFDHADLRAPFTPEAYADAIAMADAAGYPAIVVDQVSFEHAGEGGLLDMQEADLQKMAGDDWKRRESCKMSSWIRAKREHKRLMQRMLQVKAHLILCFRAEQKVEMIKGADGKWIVQPKSSLVGLEGWIPIAEKSLPYELTASFLLTADKPGMPHPIKLQEQHKPLFPLDRPITEESGRLIAHWATGGTAKNAPSSDSVIREETPGAPKSDARSSNYITPNQALDIETLCRDNEIPVAKLLLAAKVGAIELILANDHVRTLQWIDHVVTARAQKASA